MANSSVKLKSACRSVWGSVRGKRSSTIASSNEGTDFSNDGQGNEASNSEGNGVSEGKESNDKSKDNREQNQRLSFSTMSQTIVTIKVGEAQKPFHIHQDLLCHYSPYFKNLFTGSFRENEETSSTLLDVEESTFARFMDFIYSDDILMKRNGNKWAIDHDYDTVLALYIFADRYDVPQLRETTISITFGLIIKKCKNLHKPSSDSSLLPRYKEVEAAFDCLPPTSRLCKLYVDAYCKDFDDSYDNESSERERRDSIPHDFLVAVMVRHGEINNRVRNGNLQMPYKLKLCDYHEHSQLEDGQHCAFANRTD
ncbi:hypothetical protein K469DRAFT_687774 [Zopfia rhizophila CBS 207.26]|uniref:BTB domain-containing protein n=1 Tax=Zopfia rhizophila CBS 207.26 TaxID=1314779 RepID=A0A6A6E4G3_9PEZI|nr:hypothetical protein K469DRAFT_687774 [Zopfia rhizophila CBS 207.26]